MKQITHNCLRAIAILLLSGALLTGCGVAALATAPIETNVYEFTEAFTQISVSTDTATVTLMPTQEAHSKVVCVEESAHKHAVYLQNDTLVVEALDSGNLFDHVHVHTPRTGITLYLPQSAYRTLTVASTTGDVTLPADFSFETVQIICTTATITAQADITKSAVLRTTTGDIRLEDTHPGSVQLTSTTGNLTAKNILCDTLTAQASTGNIVLRHVLAAQSIDAVATTGDVKLTQCDAPSLALCTTTGDVQGTLLSEKTFLPTTALGQVHVPSQGSGGQCVVTTSTGDIDLAVVPE